MDATRPRRPSPLVTALIAALAAALGVGACSAISTVAAGPRVEHAHGGAGPRSVADLTGQVDGTPDARFVLTARTAPVRLTDGTTLAGLTFDGSAPGPEIRVRQGRLVEVVLRNESVPDGATLHWHGVETPNAEDGVAGVTQDAVPVGGEHVYRFRPGRAGTFWYHSHQSSALTVQKGLFGALVVEPAGAPAQDLVLLGHTWLRPGQQGLPAVGTATGLEPRAVPAGTRLRVRLINTDSETQVWRVSGAPFRVVAIDGVEVHEPGELAAAPLRLPAGGRYDVELTTPATPVGVGFGPAVVLSPGGRGTPPPAADGPAFDPLHHGTPAPTPFDATSRFDRDEQLVLDTVPTRRGGIPGVAWTVNGKLHDDLPPITVVDGDLVRVVIRNAGTDPHPMHLHGHHALVLSRNGEAATGSPWWTDTLLVEQGQEYVIAFRADNPGIWMDHCHNLTHAAAGMVLHLDYAGVHSPYSVGDGNTPE